MFKKLPETITGSLSLHPKGFGFVKPDQPTSLEQDVFIPKPFVNSAVDGDHVQVKINTKRVSKKGPEGAITSILKRGKSSFIGIISEIENNKDIIVYLPQLKDQDVFVLPSKEFSLSFGDRVIVEVVNWGEERDPVICEIIKVMGNISDASLDVDAVIKEFNLQEKFSHRVKKEAKAFGDRVSQKEIKDREDLRDLECITIDPDTAKDFDDALNISKVKGHYHLGVHIADVSHYVQPNSGLDKEAKKRCNTVYFPGICLPMLPHELSSNLCSLKPDVNRLAVSILAVFDKKGDLKEYRITRSVIKSKKRFTYKEAKDVLDGKKRSKHKSSLVLMTELCNLLKKKRYERGSIEFALSDTIVKVKKNGEPEGLETIEYDVTHQLVEEFMLFANETVAKHIHKKGHLVPFRIHEEPNEDSLKDFAFLTSIFGYKLSENPSGRELQEFFAEAMSTTFGQFLAVSFIRRMKMAYYTPNNIGHYGLRLDYYCHFTSPIRRYIDLVAHRILFDLPITETQLKAVSADCSDKERVSAKAEQAVILIKKLRLLKMYHEKDPQRPFRAIVTKVKPFGLHFEVEPFMFEGFMHVSELRADYFNFNPTQNFLEGKHSGVTYCLGDSFDVMLSFVDLIKLETKWSIISECKKERKKESSRRVERKGEKKPESPERKGKKKPGNLEKKSKKKAESTKKEERKYKKFSKKGINKKSNDSRSRKSKKKSKK